MNALLSRGRVPQGQRAGVANAWGLSHPGARSSALMLMAVAGLALCFPILQTPAQTNADAYSFSTLAGQASAGSADGVGSAAQFRMPWAVAVDGADNVFVADTYNFTIRKITAAGVVSTIAGLANSGGTNDGTGDNARFWYPYDIAVDGADNLYVLDNTGTRQITPVGTNWLVSTIPPVSWTNVPVDGAGNVYSEGGGGIQQLTPTGTVSTIAGSGTVGNADGTGTNAQFSLGGTFNDTGLPPGIAVDTAGNVFVADTFNNTIRQVTSAGVVTTVAGYSSLGTADGTGSNARFNNPAGVAVNNAGNLYVADSGNNTIRRVTAAGVTSTLAGLAANSGTNDGVGSYARFSYPTAIALDSAGNLYVTDSGNNTIRQVTPAGVVSTIAGLAGSYGTNDGVGSNARFIYPAGIAVDIAGNVFVSEGIGLGAGIGFIADSVGIRKITPVGTNWVVSTITSALGSGENISSIGIESLSAGGLAVDNGGNLYLAEYTTIIKLTPIGTNWVASTIAGGSLGSADGTGTSAQLAYAGWIAVDGGGNLYVVEPAACTIRKIAPFGTNWVVTTIGGLTGPISSGRFPGIPFLFDGSTDGVGTDARFYFPAGIAVDSAGTLYVADGANNTIRKGVFSPYTAANPVPYAQPPMNGQLLVTLLPSEANGQWRFPWDLAWRNSGQVVSNLVAGNYPIEFRNLPGYLAYPPTVTATVTNVGTTYVTNQYYPTVNLLGTTNTGALTVNIGPSVPNGAGWRFLGETDWRAPGSTAANLLPDTYAIEFAPISGYSKPASQAVQVPAGSTTLVWASYLLAQSPPAGVILPAPVPTNSINDLADYPYGFNGQLQSDVGYGSGVAVQPNVVLTAAHLVFNDQTLSYVSAAYWYFQQEAGVFSPEPLPARGWYVLSGYAAQRTNDLLGGLAPEQSSPQSRNLDVAALYFPSPVAGGGYGGYLPSDTVPNPWLAGTSQKMLVGYPVDGSVFGDASIVPGVMYGTGPQPYPLSLATDPVADRQVYTAPWFLSYPGNSGGPLYVQFNGYYYPAGVYLGTLYNGVVPYASLVRGIDSNVVNMITSAQTLGDLGTNYSGGVITIIAGAGSGLLAYVQVSIGPAEAVAAGAAWRVAGTTDWSTDPTYTATFTSGQSVTLEYKPIAGWNVPNNSTVPAPLGQLTVVTATYTVVPAQLAVSPSGGLAASGYAGGPFSPANVTYTLTNSGGASLSWRATTTTNWLSLSATNGTLAAGARTNITVTINASANSLAAGNYTNMINLTNLSNGLGNTNRLVSLSVVVHPPVQFTGVQLLTNRAMALTLQGATGRVYSIVASTNLHNPLTNWAEVLRLTNTGGQTVFTNPPPTNAPQYYRAKEL